MIARDGSAINPYRRNQKVTTHYSDDGYPRFGGGICAHLYVAKAWVDGYFDGAEVNHKDYDRTNYHADNLEWTSHKDNISYSSSVGRYSEGRSGSHNGRARMVSMYISQTNETMVFETIGDCAKWLMDNGYARKSSQINSVRSRIIGFIKSGENFKGLKFQYI